MTICKLCGLEKPLIKKAHIIPDFMYNGMFDEKHQILFTPITPKAPAPKVIQKRYTGEYEGNLLCSNCDNKLLGDYYENYASRVLYGGKLDSEECPEFQNIKNINGIDLLKCTKVNYHKFKLFLLSILWRSSISKRPFFKEVELGEHEDKIREMLLTKDAGGIEAYPINIFTYKHTGNIASELISQPRRLKNKEGLEYYSFLIAGYFYFFYINSFTSKFSHKILEITIRPENEIHILKLTPETGIDFIAGQFGIKPSR